MSEESEAEISFREQRALAEHYRQALERVVAKGDPEARRIAREALGEEVVEMVLLQA